MTVSTLEKAKQTSAAVPPPPRLRTPEENIIVALRPKDFGKSRLAELQELQQQFDRIKCRYDKVSGMSASDSFASAIQRDGRDAKDLSYFEEQRVAEFKVLYGQMNKVANEAVVINSALAREFSDHVSAVIDSLTAEERKPYERFAYPYQESALIVQLRKISARFQMAALRMTTSADINGSPRAIVYPLLDL